MTQGVAPNDIFHNGFWYNRNGSGGPVSAETDPIVGGIGMVAGGAAGLLSETFFTTTCLDMVSGSGALRGQLTDTGQAWETGGAGYLSTVISGDHIQGTQNTYCHLNTGAKVAKAVQYYSGTMATLSIGLDSSLTDMIHCNFNSSGDSDITYWKTGVGSNQGTQAGKIIASLPNLNDDTPHKLELHVAGNMAFSYCDGVLTSFVLDSNLSSLNGNWFFAQIHGAGEKIYGVEAYSGSATTSSAALAKVKAALVDTTYLLSRNLTIGDPSGAGFSPSSASYFWTDDTQGHVFGGSGVATVKARSEAPGNNAKLVARCYIGIETGLVSGNDGTGAIQHQDADKIKFPFNISRIDMQNPVTLPTFTVATLPSAAVAYQCTFVSDALAPTFGATVVGGGTVKVPVYSDGTNWKVG